MISPKMFLIIHGHLVWETKIFNSLGITVYLVVILVNKTSKVASRLTDQDAATVSSQVNDTIATKKLLVKKSLIKLILQITFLP